MSIPISSFAASFDLSAWVDLVYKRSHKHGDRFYSVKPQSRILVSISFVINLLAFCVVWRMWFVFLDLGEAGCVFAHLVLFFLIEPCDSIDFVDWLLTILWVAAISHLVFFFSSPILLWCYSRWSILLCFWLGGWDCGDSRGDFGFRELLIDSILAVSCSYQSRADDWSILRIAYHPFAVVPVEKG